MNIPEDVFGYNQLIRTVEKVDSEAANYLRKDAQLLSGFKFSSRLYVAFIWHHSPQGHNYWAAVSEILGEGE